jgi:multifunctional methyltransferase subunit TRM112
MRLMTHNMLQCNVKKCTNNNYPLGLEVVRSEMKETEKNPDFIRHIYRRIDVPVLKRTVDALNLEGIHFPEELTEEMLQDEVIIDMLHKVLFEVGNSEEKESERRRQVDIHRERKMYREGKTASHEVDTSSSCVFLLRDLLVYDHHHNHDPNDKIKEIMME